MKILVTGATGLIGRSCIYPLLLAGHDVRALARSPQKVTELPEKNVHAWTDDEVPASDLVSGCDAIVHLAGEAIADSRWTEERKKKLWNSRVSGTKNLVTALSTLSPSDRPKVLLCASAIGIYGLSTEAFDETSEVGRGFLSDLCVAWEKSANEAEKLGIRVVNLRTGLVLSRKGGLLSQAGPVVLGSGKQWMSWIHEQDVVDFVIHAIANPDCHGPYNLTAPHPVTHEAFIKILVQTWGIPLTIKAPAPLLKIALGEMASMILADQKILPQRTLASGFQFKFNKLEDAIEDLLGKSSFLDRHFSVKQFIACERSEVFAFFAKAENLEILTPPWLHFQIKKQSTPTVQTGTLIDYQLKIHGVPTKWRTLISHWNPEQSFIDEQVKGPYQKWHHVHTFETVPGGTLISDDVTFRLPGWIFGKILLPWIQKDIRKIFKYRQKKIQEIYSQDTTP